MSPWTSYNIIMLAAAVGGSCASAASAVIAWLALRSSTLKLRDADDQYESAQPHRLRWVINLFVAINLVCIVVLSAVWFLAPVNLVQGENLRLDAEPQGLTGAVNVRATTGNQNYGNFEWIPHPNSKTNLSQVTIPIQFPEAFTARPQVMASLSGVAWKDIGSQVWNVQVNRGSVTEVGFELIVESSGRDGMVIGAQMGPTSAP